MTRVFQRKFVGNSGGYPLAAIKVRPKRIGKERREDPRESLLPLKKKKMGSKRLPLLKKCIYVAPLFKTFCIKRKKVGRGFSAKRFTLNQSRKVRGQVTTTREDTSSQSLKKRLRHPSRIRGID